MLSNTSSARDAVRTILDFDERKRLLAVTFMWHWWLERNRVREGDQRMEPSQLAYIAQKNTDEFQAIGGGCAEVKQREKKRWKRPPQEVLKINCDGAFRSETMTGGWGFVIRDDSGIAIKARVGNCAHLMDALHAEMLAILAGVRAAGDLGISKVVVETDSMLAQLALTTSTFSLAPVGGIVYEIKYLMNLFSILYKWCFALEIVIGWRTLWRRLVVSVLPPDTVVSWDGMPPGLEDLVTSDITESSV